MIEMQRQPHTAATCCIWKCYFTFPTDAITVRHHFVTMNSDFEQFLYVYSRFLEFDLKKLGLYKTG